eukprot:scaffold59269_cov28-Tisochrysis_lutea.AAC.5
MKYTASAVLIRRCRRCRAKGCHLVPARAPSWPPTGRGPRHPRGLAVRVCSTVSTRGARIGGFDREGSGPAGAPTSSPRRVKRRSHAGRSRASCGSPGTLAGRRAS